MTWRQRERLLYLGSTFSLIPALAIVPHFPASSSTRPSRTPRYGRLYCFHFWSAPNSSTYKLVQSCVARPFSLLTMLSFGAFIVLLVIAAYTGVFLAALAERM